MIEQEEKLTREEVLKQLNIPNETLSLHEHELKINTGPELPELESFTKKDLELIHMLHKLRESGLAYSEIKLLSSLSEILLQKAQLESELGTYKEGKGSPVKGKKAKELYKAITERESQITEIKNRNEELMKELLARKEEMAELVERIELMEDGIIEMESEVEERYHEQIASLKDQIGGLVEKKQKEWEAFYSQSNEVHRKELLALQRKHEQEILKFKLKLKEQMEDFEQLKARNPLLGLLKIGAGQK